MKNNKNLKVQLYAFLMLFACLFPIAVKADELQYEVRFKYYKVETIDGEFPDIVDWYEGTLLAGEAIEITPESDDSRINPGDFIIVAPVVKTIGTSPQAHVINLYIQYDNEIFTAFNDIAHNYASIATPKYDGVFPPTRPNGAQTAWAGVGDNGGFEIILNQSELISSVQGPETAPFNDDSEIPYVVFALQVKEDAPAGKGAVFKFKHVDKSNSMLVNPGGNINTTIFYHDGEASETEIENEQNVYSSPVLYVFGEPATPSTLTGIEITNSLVPMPFPLDPLNTPFDSSVKDYSITVPNKADNVRLLLTTSSDETVITANSELGTLTKVDGGYTLDVANLSTSEVNTITFMVMDPVTGGGSVEPKTYTIEITRIDNDTSFTLNLEGIPASDITYVEATNTYLVTTTNDATKVLATPSNAEAALSLMDGETVEATTKNSDGTIAQGGLVGPSWTLTNGANTRMIIVEGADCQNKHTSVPGIGCTTQTYTILINKKSTDARLATLEVTSSDASGNPTIGSLSPAYNLEDPIGTEYTYTYPEGTTTISLNGTVNATGANITIGNGDYTLSSTVTSGTITVLAQDETTTRSYKVNFVKEVSRDSSLSSLTVKSADGATILFPTEELRFEPGTHIYNIVLPNNITSVKIEATATKGSSNVEGTGTFEIVGHEAVSKLIEVTAEDPTSTTTYTVNLTRSMSSNANITSVTIGDDTIPVSSFDPDTNTYTYTKALQGDVASISIEPTFEEPTASVKSLTGNSPLIDGNNIIRLETKAQDGTTNLYTINVYRKSADTRLAGLSVTSDPQGSMNLEFNENVRTYTYTYDEDVETITVTPTLKDGQRLESGGGDYDPSTTREAVISIKAEDGTTGEYTVNFVRQASDDATLKSLTVLKRDGTAAYRLTPVFNPETTEYDLILPHNIRFVNIIAEAESEFATISENGRMEDVEVTQFDPTNPIIRSFTVTAENNIETKTYNVRLSREKSNDASLTSITVNGTTIETSDFDSMLEYRLPDVNSDVASLDISAWTLSDEYILDNGHIDSHGTVRVLNNSLIEGEDNAVIIEVTSQNELVVKNYKLLVRRMSSFNKLDDLELITTPVGKGYLEETFNPDTLTYTYKYDRSVNNIRVNATVGATTGARIINGNGDYPIPANNTATIVVGAEDINAERKTYTINFEQIIETDNTLESLSVTNGDTEFALTPGFNPEILEYNVSVPGDVTRVTINAEKNNFYASEPTGTGNKPVNFGGNRYEVSVTSEANETRTYIININRPVSTNAKLSDLSIDGETIEGFDPDFGTYRVVVPYAKDSITIGAEKSVTTSEISGDTEEQTLAVGDNNFQVIVTAEDETTKGYYNLTVRRKSNDSTLSGLTSSVGDVTKTGDNSYRVDVPSGIGSINLSPVTNHPDATIINSASLSNISVLTPSVNIEVLAEDTDETYKSTYTVEINIVRNSNKYLSTLTTDIGTFDRAFEKTHNDYVITVESSSERITIDGMAEDAPAARIKEGDLGEIELIYGNNYHTITVIAEDGTRNTYNLTIVRPFKNILSLAYLNLNGTLIDEFTNDKTTYTVTVPYETTEITLEALALDSPDAVARGTDLGTNSFTTDRETYTFVVTSQALEVRTYSITVIRGINRDLNLTDISVLNYPLDKPFDSATPNYDIGEVLDSVTALTVLAETSNTDAYVYYRIDENENTESNVLALDDSIGLGPHTIVIGIRVEDQVNTYYINFTRIASGLDRITSAKKVDGETDIHEIDELYIQNNRPDITISDYKREFANEYTELHVYNADGSEEQADTSSLATGMIMKLERHSVVLDQKTIVIIGETTGEGVVNVADAFRVIQHSLGNDLLTGAFLVAANTNGDDAVNVADAFRIIQHSLGNDLFEW